MDEYEWIREGLKRPGKSRKGLAQAMGVSDSAITSLLGAETPRVKASATRSAKRRKLKTTEIEKIVSYLGVEPPPFHKPKTVPVFAVLTGDLATASIYQFDEMGGSSVGIPPGDQGSTAALIVRGANMRGLVSGDWIVYFGNRECEEIQKFQGILCVIGYGNNEIMVGVFSESKYEGLFDLDSFFGSPSKIAQQIAWVADVKSLVPPHQASGYLTADPFAPHPEILKIRNDA